MAAIELPTQLAVSSYRFIKLGSSGERLKRPIEIGWNIFNLEELDSYIKDRQKKWDEDELNGKHEDLICKIGFAPKRPVFRGRLNNYGYDEPEFVEWLQKGNNYGVTSSGGLIKLESDDIERWRALGVLELLPETFTVQSSSPNRQHFYYDGPVVADSPLKDPATNEDIGHIRGTGEAGGRGGMVVGPGSLHPHNVRYTVIKDLPIAKLTKDVLDKVKSILCGNSTQQSEKKQQGTGKTDYKDPFKNVTISSVLGANYQDFNLEGSQMAGPNPYGIHTNQNGHCLVIEADDKGFYCFECERGGGVSRLIAIRAGLMRCDEKGAPTGRVWWDTIRYALKEGIINEETAREVGLEPQNGPTIRKASIEDQSGTVGLAEDGTVKQVVVNKDEVKSLIWISDCALYIDTETSANNVTEFTFKGEGAKDHRKVSFTLQADSLEHQKFKTALINAFGAVNRVGKLDFETVQRLTRNTRFIRRVEVPSWNDNTPMIPGVGLARDTEFRLSPMTPAKVVCGDLQTAKDLLRTLLKTHPFTSILVTAIMGAPAVARWRPDDRIAVALWAGTGTQKTTVAKACMSIYGSEYQSDRYLLKHGRGGSTLVAALEIMARAGILPQILDDVKAVDPKDHQNYVTVVHAIIEGSDKQRGKKDGGLRESQIFRSTPIITGEVRPEEASTDARVCNLSWSKPDLDRLNEIESRAGEMPIIGYHWLRFLAETDLNLNDGFNTARSKKELEFSRAGYTTNPGRLATIYTVLMATWKLLCESPLGEVFKEATEDFTQSLTRAIQEQGLIVNGDTEVSKFLAGVNELLASQPGLFQSSDGKTLLGRVVGKHTDEGLFLLPNETLAELDKLKVFTQKPTVDSMGKALADAGKLIRDKDGKNRQIARRMSGKLVRGWLLLPDAITVTNPIVTEKQQQEPPDTTVTGVTTENERKFFEENIENQTDESDSKKESKESSRNSRNTRNSNVIDSDFSDTTPSPSKKEVGTPPSLDGIQADLQRADELTKAKEEHFKTSSKVRWTEDQPKPEKKKQCLMCGKDSEGHNFIPYYNNGESGYICTSCSMGQTIAPTLVKLDSQTKLNSEVQSCQ